MDENAVIIKGPGRRDTDEECVAHEKRIDGIDNEIHKQSGWFKASAILLSIAVIVLGSLCSLILNKLGTIEGLMADNKVTTAEFSMAIKNMDKRISDIEERNKYIDQQSGLLGAGRSKTP